MEPTSPPALRLAGSRLAFTAVPQQRQRADGWTPETQANFIRALSAMGSVGQAARAVGMGRASAYRLRAKRKTRPQAHVPGGGSRPVI